MKYLFVLLLLPSLAWPCSLCVNVRQSPTFRQEAGRPSAHVILHGTLENPRLSSDNIGNGAGATDFRVIEVLKVDERLPAGYRKKAGDILVLPSYFPIEDAKNPPHFLAFCSATREGLTPYRYVTVTSNRMIDYFKAAAALPANDTRGNLGFFFRHLDDGDESISNDAFLEMSRASDREIGEMGQLLKPDSLRRWLRNPNTPEMRLGLYAFLLGSCGTREDADWFQATLARPTEKQVSAYDGLLGGYIQMRPREGWDLAERLLREGRQPLLVRLSAVRALRFYMAWKPVEMRPAVRRCLSAILLQGELVDCAVEDLRRWQMWELTKEVLAQYGRKGFDAPMYRRAIIRYAVSCPSPAAKTFVAELRKRDAETVSEIEESLSGTP
jgi:hypothetical protein